MKDVIKMNLVNQEPLSLIITLAITIIIIATISFFLLYKKHKLHYTKYHKYNKQLICYEKKHNLNLINKKIRFKKRNPLYLSHIKENVDNINEINAKINKLDKKMYRTPDLLESISPLSLIENFVDPQESLLLNDIISLFKPRHYHHFFDEFILKAFGNKNFLYFKNRYIFYYNQFIIDVPIINKIAYPNIIKGERLSVKVSKQKEGKKYCEYILQVLHHQKVIIKLKKKVKITDNVQFEKLMNLVEYYDVFYKCPSLKEATTKSEHLRKMNEQTLERIQSMSGKKFINWVKDAFKSLYGQEPILKQAQNGSYYLLLSEVNGSSNIVVQVKRHSENITSTYIKELKAIQVSEMGDEAWIISASSFTKQAKNLAQETNVKIIENEDLMNIIRKYNHNYYRSF